MPVSLFIYSSQYKMVFLLFLALKNPKSLPVKYHPKTITESSHFMHMHLLQKHVQPHEQNLHNSTAVLQNLCSKTRCFTNTASTKENFFLVSLLTKFSFDVTLSSWQADCHLTCFMMTCQWDFASFSYLFSALTHSMLCACWAPFFNIYQLIPPFSTRV